MEVDARDAAVGGGVALGLEGRVAHQELVQEHPQAPDVHHGVVRASLCLNVWACVGAMMTLCIVCPLMPVERRHGFTSIISGGR